MVTINKPFSKTNRQNLQRNKKDSKKGKCLRLYEFAALAHLGERQTDYQCSPTTYNQINLLHL